MHMHSNDTAIDDDNLQQASTVVSLSDGEYKAARAQWESSQEPQKSVDAVDSVNDAAADAAVVA